MRRKLFSKILLMQFFVVSISFASCSKDDSSTTPTDTIPEIPGYTLVWNDEFDGNYIDLTKWEYEVNGDKIIIFF